MTVSGLSYYYYYYYYYYYFYYQLASCFIVADGRQDIFGNLVDELIESGTETFDGVQTPSQHNLRCSARVTQLTTVIAD